MVGDVKTRCVDDSDHKTWPCQMMHGSWMDDCSLSTCLTSSRARKDKGNSMDHMRWRDLDDLRWKLRRDLPVSWTLLLASLLLLSIPYTSGLPLPLPILMDTTTSKITSSAANLTITIPLLVPLLNTSSTTISTSTAPRSITPPSPSATSSDNSTKLAQSTGNSIATTNRTVGVELFSSTPSTTTSTLKGETAEKQVIPIPPIGKDKSHQVTAEEKTGNAAGGIILAAAPTLTGLGRRPEIPRLDGKLKDGPPGLDEDNKEEDMVNNLPGDEDGDENMDGGERIVSGDKPRLFDKPRQPLRSGDRDEKSSSSVSQDDHAFGYLVALLVVCVILVVFWRKRQRILAYLIEGRRSGSRRRNASRSVPTAQYRKLTPADDD